MGFERARERRWRVGTKIPLIPPQFAAEAARIGVRNLQLEVVGTVATPGDFPPLEEGRPSIYLTPAFHKAYARSPLLDDVGQAVIARLERGAADVPAFRAAIERLARGKPISIAAQADQTDDVERSLQLQAVALWVFAALLALTGLLVLGQALARQAFLETAEHDTLRALGMTRRQLWAVGVLRALLIGVMGTAIALAAAFALSPLAPLGGLARTAEPDLGVSIDATAFAVGGAAIVFITALLAAPAAWLAARGAPAGPDVVVTGSAVARALARLGASAPVVTGVRMALEPGRGRSAVPVRSTIVGITIGVMAFAAALTFGSSSNHLLDTPRLYGWNWDLALAHFEGLDLRKKGTTVLAHDPAVESFSVGGLGESLRVDGRRMDAIALDRVRGSVLPPVVDGRAPGATGEILLGAKTMRSLGVDIGDTVTVRGERRARMRVVGQGVLPAALSNTARLGQGALILSRDAQRLGSDDPPSDTVMRVAPGADRGALVRRLRRQLGEELYIVPQRKPLDIVDFGRVRGLPLILAALLGILAAATLLHVLVTAVRRRRRELAVLKTLGFVRGQVRTVVLAQSLTYACVAVLIGLPLGVAAGRFAWSLFAERQGIVTEVVVPLPVLLLVIPAATLLAGLLALAPARWAAATPPAAVLRTE